MSEDKYYWSYMDCREDSDIQHDVFFVGGFGTTGSILPSDPKFFYKKKGWCPYCRRDMPIVNRGHWSTPSDQYNLQNHFYLTVWACDSCGWWDVDQQIIRGARGEMRIVDACYRIVGVLKRFSVRDDSAPIEALRAAVRMRNELLYKISPRKMEIFVQSVLKDFFDCEVMHCGRRGDEGVDLLFVNSNKPTAVQVKRRSHPSTIEPVSEIREFLGALSIYEKNIQNAMYVTSAKRFTRGSVNAAKKSEEYGIIDKFELVDFDRVISILNLVRKGHGEPWRRFLKYPDWLKHDLL